MSKAAMLRRQLKWVLRELKKYPNFKKLPPLGARSYQEWENKKRGNRND